MGTHDKCPAMKVEPTRLLMCAKSPEHVNSSIKERRLHYDPDYEAYWADEKEE